MTPAQVAIMVLTNKAIRIAPPLTAADVAEWEAYCKAWEAADSANPASGKRG